uniref:Uncharacterized protein n=1 Tax=Oryza punctata TaxID=4537 RepID=A0A0E0MFA6_ORYPU
MWEQEAAALRRKEKRKTRHRGAHARWEKKRNESMSLTREYMSFIGLDTSLKEKHVTCRSREGPGPRQVKSQVSTLFSVKNVSSIRVKRGPRNPD